MRSLSPVPSPPRAKLWPAALSIATAVLIVGIAYGAIARAAGFPDWLIVVTAIVVLGASSELLFVGIVAAGGLPVIAALAALIVNFRNAVYAFSAAPFLPRNRGLRLLHAHLVNDESVAFALAQKTPAERLRAFRLLGVLIFIAWPLGAVLGILLGTIAPDPKVLGLDAAFPAIFIAILASMVQRRTAGPAVLGAGIAVAATPFVVSGLAPILGLLGLSIQARRSRGARRTRRTTKEHRHGE
ncbi:AzlC family ABC transporter permease [Humidisolicoccus flavus]|uniref:AzlC family ABC transporter permease n=1 Tax=Humidisolicoccus flavus TaxID=3111414 RepID=UPI0032530B05